MQINIPNEIIEQMVKEQVDKSIRTRIKEMQGDYTSKAFILNIIQDVIWNKITELYPDVEQYIQSEIKYCIDSTLNINMQDIKFSKKELVKEIAKNLLIKINKE